MPRPPMMYGRHCAPSSPKNQRPLTPRPTLSHSWPPRHDVSSNFALLIVYSKSTARCGLTHTPTPTPPHTDVSVSRLLSEKFAPMRGAMYQLPKSWAWATALPPTSARAMSALRALRFIQRTPLSFWFKRVPAQLRRTLTLLIPSLLTSRDEGNI